MSALHIICALALALSASASSLPAFEYSSLSSSGPSLLSSLLTHSGVAITGIPGYADGRRALIDLAPPTIVDHVRDDETGLLRATVTGNVKNGVPDSASSLSSIDQLQPLRAAVDDAVAEFLGALKGTVPSDMLGVKRESGLVEGVDALKGGNGIEHYHYYSGETGSSDETPVMHMHVDAGCFIAMTVGGSSSTDYADPFTLTIRPGGKDATEADADPDSLIIMLGDGINTFMHGTRPFQALQHSLSTLDFDTDRAWYGRMFFPPSDAVLPSGETFDEVYRRLASDDSTPSNGILGSSDCGADEVYCWKQCMSVSALPCDSSSALCFDPGADSGAGGIVPFPASRDSMCVDMGGCHLVCADTLNGLNSTDHGGSGSGDFCTGTGTDMYMDGFTFAAASSDNFCLNLLLPGWTLDSAGKFMTGLTVQFLLAVFVEYLSAVRRRTFKKYNLYPSKRQYYKVVLTFLHMLQGALGYFIMLAAMSYSVEFFAAIILGLGLGHFFFNVQQPPSGKAEPCCAEDQFRYSEIDEDNRGETKPLVDSLKI